VYMAAKAGQPSRFARWGQSPRFMLALQSGGQLCKGKSRGPGKALRKPEQSPAGTNQPSSCPTKLKDFPCSEQRAYRLAEGRIG